MKVLVLNCGSSSLRFQLLEMEEGKLIAKGAAEQIGSRNSYYKYENYQNHEVIQRIEIKNHIAAVDWMLQKIIDPNYGVLNNLKEIDVIGHRIVHGGELYTEAIIIDPTVNKDLNELSELAPLHNFTATKVIAKIQTEISKTPNVAVFDTAFHMTIPPENYLYPIPIRYYKKYGIRKYGFHGTSYEYVLERVENIMKTKKEQLNMILCHLGGGCSICAVKNGKSYDTTMGFTPLDGVMMATRCGNIDPSIPLYLMEKEELSTKEMKRILNLESGYYGICGDADAKRICERSDQGDPAAIQTRKIANQNFKKNLLGMMSGLKEINGIVMTGGMGSKNYQQRELFLGDLDQFGIKIDPDTNKKTFDTEACISKQESEIPIFVIPTNEELQIAKESVRVLRK